LSSFGLSFVLRLVVRLSVPIVEVASPKPPIHIAHLAAVELGTSRHRLGVEDIDSRSDLGVGQVWFVRRTRRHVVLAKHNVDVEVAMLAGLVITSRLSIGVPRIDVSTG
jgi:hypothetical protein